VLKDLDNIMINSIDGNGGIIGGNLIIDNNLVITSINGFSNAVTIGGNYRLRGMPALRTINMTRLQNTPVSIKFEVSLTPSS
jgi:hypothetical protein